MSIRVEPVGKSKPKKAAAAPRPSPGLFWYVLYCTSIVFIVAATYLCVTALHHQSIHPDQMGLLSTEFAALMYLFGAVSLYIAVRKFD